MYGSIASLLGCSPDEVALTESATRAWDLAFASVPLAAGDVVVTSRAEYVSNMLGMLRSRDLHEVRIEILPDDDHGQVSLDALDDRLSVGDVSLVALTHVPSQSGLVNPAAEAGRPDAGGRCHLPARRLSGRGPDPHPGRGAGM